MKSIVIYFSRSGETMIDGRVKNISKGFTEIVAEKIAQIANADIFKLEAEEPYPDNYFACDRRIKEEYETNALPAIAELPLGLKEYDVIYIGFPIYYRTFPRIIAEFSKHFDFTDKIIKPFCTNEEGTFGTAELELRSLLKGSVLKAGFAIRGYKADMADDDGALSTWIQY